MKLTSSTKIFLIVFALVFLIRLPGISQTASIDEGGYLAREYYLNWHPPISILAHDLSRAVLGNHAWVSRLLILIIGMINLVMAYKLASKLCGERAGLFAAALMGIGAYPLLASLQMDMDGSFLLMFYLATTLSFLKYMDNNRVSWLIFTGISLGLGLLTKYPAIFILPILGLYYLITKKDILSTIKVTGIVFIIGLVIFSVFPIWSYLSGSSFFADTLAHFSRYVSDSGLDLTLLAVQFLLFILWSGPLFIGLFALSLTKWKKGYLLPIIWILAIVVFYAFINKDNFKPLERYFTVLIAPICVMIGSYLCRLRFSKREIGAIALLTILCLGSFMLLNLHGEQLPFYPKTGFIGQALSFSWNFYLPIAGSSGPIGFLVNFRIVAIAFIVAAICIPVLFFTVGKAGRRAFVSITLIIFLSLSLAYNLFFAQEFLFSTTSPSVDKVTKDIIGYAETHDLPTPIYIFRNTAMRYYLRDKYTDLRFIDFDIENNQTRIAEITSNSTLIIVDFPKLDEESLFWKRLENCPLEQGFSDKGFEMGKIYFCDE